MSLPRVTIAVEHEEDLDREAVLLMLKGPHFEHSIQLSFDEAEDFARKILYLIDA